MHRTFREIQERIARKDAVIITAKEVEELLDSGKENEVRKADVVTCGTMGTMSGTYALLCFRISEAGKYRKFTKASINDVPAAVGPCPNESLGMIDVMVFGTSESEERPEYGGSFLFRDLVEGKEVTVRAISESGREIETSLSIEDMTTAKLLSTRNCFRNYRAFVNPSEEEFRSIFHCIPFPPSYGGLTFSGCGHINPLQNDPELLTVGVGTKVLFNGAEGHVCGMGTRCSNKYPNIMSVADMKGMDPSLMGGFMTAAGPECLATYAVPIPVMDESILKHVMALDRDIPLSVGDIRDRHKIGQADYGQAWTGRDESITFDGSSCEVCPECLALSVCPTFAIGMNGNGPYVDRSRCVNCGACTYACPRGCFKGRMGEISTEIDGRMISMPIVCRNSNREGAIRSMDDLRERILDGSFLMTEKVSDMRIR